MSGKSNPHENRIGTAAVGNEDADRRQYSRDLREGEQSLRLQVGGLRNVAIFTLDRSGRVATWNAGAERFKGYKAAEIIGKDFSCFYSAEDIAASKPKRELAIAEQEGCFEGDGLRIRIPSPCGPFAEPGRSRAPGGREPDPPVPAYHPIAGMERCTPPLRFPGPRRHRIATKSTFVVCLRWGMPRTRVRASAWRHLTTTACGRRWRCRTGPRWRRRGPSLVAPA